MFPTKHIAMVAAIAAAIVSGPSFAESAASRDTAQAESALHALWIRLQVASERAADRVDADVESLGAAPALRDVIEARLDVEDARVDWRPTGDAAAASLELQDAQRSLTRAAPATTGERAREIASAEHEVGSLSQALTATKPDDDAVASEFAKADDSLRDIILGRAPWPARSPADRGA